MKTAEELFEFRKIYNALIFNEWARQGKYQVHKSKRHSDGEPCLGGDWFVVIAELPTGQISNHYRHKDWDLFKIEARETANKYDGHNSQDVQDRIIEYIYQLRNKEL